MAITIDYSDDVTPQYVIQIPRADMLDVTGGAPTEIRQLNIDEFRRDLDDLMDDEIGMAFPTTHFHTPPLTISGVTLARVLEILDPYVIEFEDGTYNVNVVGGNSNVSDVTVKNSVGVNTANSAGLQDPFALQAAAFAAGEVNLDPAGGSGTVFPNGTRSFPVNNIADAIAICEERGIRSIRVLEEFTFSSGDFSDGYRFVGDNKNLTLTIDPGANITNCEFVDCTVTGTLDGNNGLLGCHVGTLNFFNGYIERSGIAGTITLGGTSIASFIDCYSLVSGAGPAQYPLINFGGTHSADLAVRNWHGGLGLENRTGGTASASIDMSSGRVIVESDVSTGTITVRGLAEVEDNSTGTADVQNLTINSDVGLTRKLVANTKIASPDTSSPLGVGYESTLVTLDDDDATILHVHDLSEDAAETQEYRNQGYNVQRKR